MENNCICIDFKTGRETIHFGIRILGRLGDDAETSLALVSMKDISRNLKLVK